MVDKTKMPYILFIATNIGEIRLDGLDRNKKRFTGIS